MVQVAIAGGSGRRSPYTRDNATRSNPEHLEVGREVIDALRRTTIHEITILSRNVRKPWGLLATHD